MKGGIFNLLKARFLINEGSTKNWMFILYIIFLAILLIANTNRYEQKVFAITDLTTEVKELRSKFVDKRSQLMKLKMESTVSEKMIERNIFPASVPPQKIKVIKPKDTSFFKKIWH